MVIIACHVYGIVAFFHRDVDNRWVIPTGVLQYLEVGKGLDLTSSLEANFRARSSQIHQIREKNLGSSVTIRHKSWGKIPILGSSEIQRAKFGAPSKISEANFGGEPPPTC